MATTHSRRKVEFSEFEKNRQQFTDEQLLPYQGMWVGFSLDGRRIVGSGKTLEELNAQVERAGEHISMVSLEYIDLEGGIYIGGSETI